MAIDDDGDDYYDEEEYDNSNDYKEHQRRYESLTEEWHEESHDWDAERRQRHLENMRSANEE